MSGQKKKSQQPVLSTTQEFRSYDQKQMGDLFLSPTGVPSLFVPSPTISVSIRTPVASGGGGASAKPSTPARPKTTKPSGAKKKEGGAKKK